MKAPSDTTLLQNPPFPLLPPSTYEMLIRGQEAPISAELYKEIFPSEVFSFRFSSKKYLSFLISLCLFSFIFFVFSFL